MASPYPSPPPSDISNPNTADVVNADVLANIFALHSAQWQNISKGLLPATHLGQTVGNNERKATHDPTDLNQDGAPASLDIERHEDYIGEDHTGGLGYIATTADSHGGARVGSSSQATATETLRRRMLGNTRTQSHRRGPHSPATGIGPTNGSKTVNTDKAKAKARTANDEESDDSDTVTRAGHSSRTKRERLGHEMGDSATNTKLGSKRSGKASYLDQVLAERAKRQEKKSKKDEPPQ